MEFPDPTKFQNNLPTSNLPTSNLPTSNVSVTFEGKAEVVIDIEEEEDKAIVSINMFI